MREVHGGDKMAIQDRGNQPRIGRWSARSWTLQRLDSAGLRRIEDRGRAGPRPRMKHYLASASLSVFTMLAHACCKSNAATGRSSRPRLVVDLNSFPSR